MPSLARRTLTFLRLSCRHRHRSGRHSDLSPVPPHLTPVPVKSRFTTAEGYNLAGTRIFFTKRHRF